jgi:LAS superfamily LD-carboxypeptidase LdcB
VSCSNGGSITVAGSIAGNVSDMLQAAAADGLALCGGGYRDPDEQIALRRAHCGTSPYAIYEMPSSQCSPPTARPGRSNHEKGLAIDFANCSSRSTACYQWLNRNAARFGLYNLPSESWHWSVNGN